MFEIENEWIVELSVVLLVIIFAGLGALVSYWWFLGLIIPFALIFIFIDIFD